MLSRKFLFILAISIFYSCMNKAPEGFVYIEENIFKVDDQDYFPRLMNYGIAARVLEDEIILSPSIEYDNPKTFDSNTILESKERMRSHFRAIKKMGFNSIRLVGLSNLKYEESGTKTSIELFEGNGRTPLLIDSSSILKLTNALENLVLLAGEENLRVMPILPRPMKDLNYTKVKDKFVGAILSRFKDNHVIFAYDFFNEPLYFDNSEHTHWQDRPRTKVGAYRLVKKWKDQMSRHAPKQLFTIGLAEPIEVFEWDPEILPVDFVSFHTYHPLRVFNEIYWYAKYVNKPWMVTETSLPADNDSISFKDQAIFMKEVFERIVNCGGSGIGWWQYQDVQWGPFEHNYTPLIKVGGKSLIDSNTFIYGEFKDAAFVMPQLEVKKSGECDCHTNYFNMMGYHNYRIKGLIVDTKNEPIEGAVIRGWNQYWTVGQNTFTNENGIFNLYSNDECVHFEISAPGYSKVKFNLNLTYEPHPDSLDLKNVGLEYHKNHFQWYLDSNYVGESVFRFKKDLFDDFETSAVLDTIKLESLTL